MGGKMTSGIGIMLTAVVIAVLGVVMAPIVVDNAATTGASTNINSFTGTKSFNDLVPLFYYIGLILVLIGGFTVGSLKAAGRF